MSEQKDPLTLPLSGSLCGFPLPQPLCRLPLLTTHPILKSPFPVPNKLPDLSALACAVLLPRMPFHLPSCPHDKLFVLPVTFSLWLLCLSCPSLSHPLSELIPCLCTESCTGR